MKQTHEYRRDEDRVHLILYHLIWCPRRRKPVLEGPVAARWRELLVGTCAERGCELLVLALQPDHRHLLVRVWPSESASQVVKESKGLTSSHLRKAVPDLLKLPSLWTRSFFASSTAATVSQEPIQRSIAAQTRR